MVERRPFNIVTAQVLELALQSECSKARWRDAMQAAVKRWKEEGNEVVRVRASGAPSERRKAFVLR